MQQLTRLAVVERYDCGAGLLVWEPVRHAQTSPHSQTAFVSFAWAVVLDGFAWFYLLSDFFFAVVLSDL